MSDDSKTQTQIQTPEFLPSTHERYWESIEIIMPVAESSKGFLVGEPWSHRECRITGRYRATYPAMVRRQGQPPQYFESTAGLTVPEWHALNVDTLKIEVAS